MEDVFSFLKYKKKTEEEKEIEAEREEIMTAINDLKIKMDSAQMYLEFAIDEALIDSIIYEIISLQKKYDYYLRICKSKQFSVEVVKSRTMSVS